MVIISFKSPENSAKYKPFFPCAVFLLEIFCSCDFGFLWWHPMMSCDAGKMTSVTYDRHILLNTLQMQSAVLRLTHNQQKFLLVLSLPWNAWFWTKQQTNINVCDNNLQYLNCVKKSYLHKFTSLFFITTQPFYYHTVSWIPICMFSRMWFQY